MPGTLSVCSAFRVAFLPVQHSSPSSSWAKGPSFGALLGSIKPCCLASSYYLGMYYIGPASVLTFRLPRTAR